MPVISTYSLAPYTKWETDDLLHLLRRTLFGIGHKELDFFKGKTLSQSLDIILTPSPLPKPPIQEDPDITDPLIANGAEWINAPYENELIDGKRADALRSWWVSHLIGRDYSLTEKMILFWHNHFPIEMDFVKDARYGYQYHMFLRKNALGNFKELIMEGTINPAMLVYLNGNSNQKAAPNENYSRELMELFTLGKAHMVKYTEEDVKSAAKVLTGWKDDKQTLRVEFFSELHDTSDKRFSSFFGNKVIKGKTGTDGADETGELIEMIFQSEETAKFFCRNIYRWFVCAYMDEQTEQNIIGPLAKILIDHNYDIVPVLRTLLSSQHFYDPVFRGCIEKSPVDFLVGVIQQFGVAFPNTAPEDLLCSFIIHDFMGGLSMVIGNPPSVAGWPAYHQAPKYHQWWINPGSLSVRMELANSLNSTAGMRCNGPYIKFEPIAFVGRFNNPGDANELVENCASLFLAVKISDHAKNKLKATLVAENEPPDYWSKAWKKYEAEGNGDVIEPRLRNFFKTVTNMVQYQMT